MARSIKIRLSNNSLNKETFKKAIEPYDAALKENETELGDHDFCLSHSHYTDTDPTSSERKHRIHDRMDYSGQNHTMLPSLKM